MDVIRATIKALFYDYSPSFVSEIIAGKSDENLLAPFVRIVQWREQVFTQSELSNLVRVLQQEWMNRKGLSYLPKEARPLSVLNVFAQKVLKKNAADSYPCVMFDELLRWRSLSLCISEDVLITSFLAESDASQREHFIWKSVLPHDNVEINSLFDADLIDIHHHMWASIDVAELNWIRLMNNVSLWPTEEYLKENLSQFQKDLDLDTSYREIVPLRQLSIVASAIRLFLYGWLNDIPNHNIFDTESINKLILNKEDTCTKWSATGLEENIVNFRDYVRRIEYKNLPWDYAINNKTDIPDSDLISPYMLHFGERKLLYDMFYRIYHPSSKEEKSILQVITPYFYLYLLIKIKIRKELVQTNPLKGLNNFFEYMIYQKIFFNDKSRNQSDWDRILYRYSMQTSSPRVETRMTFDDWAKMKDEDINKAVFVERNYLNQNINDNGRKYSIVASVSKGDELGSHNGSKSLFEKILEQQKSVLKHIGEKEILPIVGVDFTGMEVYTRPEKCAVYIRYLRKEGFKGFTYHVGEDFYDLIDGLRSIWELVEFAEFTKGDRLGHALALGIDVESYYESKHYNVLIPKQCLLDNIVWLLKIVEDQLDQYAELTEELLSEARTLFKDGLHYKGNFDLNLYYKSILLRGDCVVEEENGLGTWSKVSRPTVYNKERDDERIRNLCEEYRKKTYKDSILYQLPVGIVKLIKEAQNRTKEKIKELHIETCPSSNLMIGAFKRYDNLPMHSLKDMSLSINTDDKGIFATSLENEYSLIALSLKKKNTPMEEIINYLKMIKDNASQNAFSI